jgi:hypothetical protein
MSTNLLLTPQITTPVNRISAAKKLIFRLEPVPISEHQTLNPAATVEGKPALPLSYRAAMAA